MPQSAQRPCESRLCPVVLVVWDRLQPFLESVPHCGGTHDVHPAIAAFLDEPGDRLFVMLVQVSFPPRGIILQTVC